MSIAKKISPGRIIVLGFLLVILTGTLLLYLPISANPGVKVSLIDALFTSTSAVCVTGLIVIDTADGFNVFGQTVIALLIQIGGLGVASLGIGFMLFTGKRIGVKSRVLLKEAMNLASLKGVIRLFKSVILITLIIEGLGALLSFFVFVQDYKPLKAVGMSVFHSIASFNNAGFDIFGNFQSMIPYQNNVLLNLTTCALIIFGGLGFPVIMELKSKHNFKKFSLHTKVVLVMTAFLLIAGTLLLKLTEDFSWMGAFFNSTSARTAGFSTYNLAGFTNAGLFVLVILMFIGASPCSTGGGIKTTTTFVLFKGVISMATNKHCTSFKRRISNELMTKAFMILILALVLIVVDIYILSILEPSYSFIQIMVEVTSAFGTVGLSTGITPELGGLSKLILIGTMFVGRLGPLTMATIWYFKPLPNASYSEESIAIG